MNPQVLKLAEAVRDAGGRAMLVGGCVRDRLLGIESKDLDVEVYRVDPARLRELLKQLGNVNTVGEHFSVYKLVVRNQSNDLDRVEIDVSIPRRESKSGQGHRGFLIEGDPSMTFEEAARRRDFTINAILYDPLTDETVDPFAGRTDLENRLLKAVDAGTFIEDSLRVLRAVQLAARFELTLDPDTAQLCRSINLSDIPHERIWGEFEKLLMLAEHPSIALETALELAVLDKLFPELRALVGRKSGHTSEDAFEHMKRSLDEAARICADLTKAKRLTVMLAVLCHDLSTDSKTRVEATLSVVKRLGVYSVEGYDVRSQVLNLVREQSAPHQFYESRASTTDGDFRRLAQNAELDLLYRVTKACGLAQDGCEIAVTAADWFIDRARVLGVEHEPSEPLLQGRHLLEAGVQPGPEMGRLLKRVYELQLDGEVTTRDQALSAALRIRDSNT
jgi:tRNA nucleotidyltransferase (CCA-adding enzyme)